MYEEFYVKQNEKPDVHFMILQILEYQYLQIKQNQELHLINENIEVTLKLNLSNMEQEIWKDIPWYEWLYQASNLWRVKSLDRIDLLKRNKYSCILNFIPSSWWYIRIRLCKNSTTKSFNVHRIVAQVFLWLDINNKKIVVCHKDDNPSNNRVDNLFLWSQKNNIEDMIKKWRRPKSYVFNYKLTNTDILWIKEMLKNRIKQKDIAIVYSVSESTISEIKNWNKWKNIN